MCCTHTYTLSLDDIEHERRESDFPFSLLWRVQWPCWGCIHGEPRAGSAAVGTGETEQLEVGCISQLLCTENQEPRGQESQYETKDLCSRPRALPPTP